MFNIIRILNRIFEVNEGFGLSLNINKTKYMIISKKQMEDKEFFIRDQ